MYFFTAKRAGKHDNSWPQLSGTILPVYCYPTWQQPLFEISVEFWICELWKTILHQSLFQGPPANQIYSTEMLLPVIFDWLFTHQRGFSKMCFELPWRQLINSANDNLLYNLFYHIILGIEKQYIVFQCLIWA